MIVTTIFLAACAAVPDSTVNAEPTAREYAVYAALLFDRWSAEGKSAFVIRRETLGPADFRDFNRTAEFLKKELLENKPPILLENDLVESFRRVHTSSVRLDPRRLEVPNATIVASSEIDSTFRDTRTLEDGWAAFRNEG